MGLAVNDGKTKHMLSTSRDVRRVDFQITADNYTFDTVKEFIYLGSAVIAKNDISLEIKRTITFTKRCYYGLNGQNNTLQDAHPIIRYPQQKQFISSLKSSL